MGHGLVWRQPIRDGRNYKRDLLARELLEELDSEPAAAGLTWPMPDGAIMSSRIPRTADLNTGSVTITATSAAILRLSYGAGIDMYIAVVHCSTVTATK